VVGYQEQPCVIHYYDASGEVRDYVPDLRLDLDDGSQIFIEVKPTSQLAKPEVNAKLTAIAQTLAERGVRFRILTEKDIRREPLFGNLQRLHEATKSHLATGLLEGMAMPLGQRWTLGQFIRNVTSEAQAFALLGLGYLRADLEKELDDAAELWLEGCEEARNGAFRI
jgi:hypothetical protein